jgi:hypothetical protein
MGISESIHNPDIRELDAISKKIEQLESEYQAHVQSIGKTFEITPM